jgi:multidrug efflux pump subunit AcrA (membrane-fusion protein)
MFEALDVNGVEINAQLPIRHMRALVSHLEGTDLNGQLLLNPREVLKSLGLSARVRLVGGMPYANWEARVLRISESIDPARRTLGIVVGVDNPYEKVIPGKRPPLLKGMYTAIELFAPAREALVIPRKAVHEGCVYVSNKKNRLEIKSVDIQFQQGNYVVIKNGIQEGEKIIVNDLIPIIEGMPLRPTPAEEYIDKGATFDKENVLP